MNSKVSHEDTKTRREEKGSREGAKTRRDVEALAAIVVDCALNLHEDLGPGLLESVYEAVLANLLQQRGLSVERQKSVPICYQVSHPHASACIKQRPRMSDLNNFVSSCLRVPSTSLTNFAPSRLRVSDLLEQHFDTAFAAPDGITKLRELILTLAMQGKLVEQDLNDPPARELLKEIEAEKERGSHEGTKTRREEMGSREGTKTRRVLR